MSRKTHWCWTECCPGTRDVQCSLSYSVTFFVPSPFFSLALISARLGRCLLCGGWMLWAERVWAFTSRCARKVTAGCERTVNQPASWTLFVHSGWMSRGGRIRCHCDDLTSHGTNTSDSSRDRCYAVTMPKTLMRILPRRLVSIKDCCFLVAGF